MVNPLSTESSFCLAYLGLVTSYDDMDLGQHWIRCWFVAWWYQAIIWTNDDLTYNHEPMAICFGCCSCSVAHQYQYICRHRPLCGEFTSDWWIPHTNGQWSGKNVSIWWRHHGYVIKNHFTIVLDISLLPILSKRRILKANGRFPYLFVMISPQVITLMSTLLCFCFCCVLINAIFAPDFATVTFVLLASNNLCCRLTETFFILCQWNGYKCCPDYRNNG